MVRLNFRKRNSLLIANTFHCVIQSKSLIFNLIPENFFKFESYNAQSYNVRKAAGFFFLVSTLNIVGNAIS